MFAEQFNPLPTFLCHKITVAGTSLIQQLDFNTFSPTLIFKTKFKEIVQAQAALFGCEAAFDRLVGPILPVINNEDLAKAGAQAIESMLGSGILAPKDLNMGSESFSVLCK